MPEAWLSARRDPFLSSDFEVCSMPSPHYTTAKREGPDLKTWPFSFTRLFHPLRPKVVKQQAEV